MVKIKLKKLKGCSFLYYYVFFLLQLLPTRKYKNYSTHFVLCVYVSAFYLLLLRLLFFILVYSRTMNRLNKL